MAQVKLTGNNSMLTTSSFIQDFSLIKAFNVTIHLSRTSTIKKIICNMLILNLIKCSCDGSYTNFPTTIGSRGIFRDCRRNFILTFA